jgi:DNA-directed RNA polymerase specialized sigma24 family protein
MAKGKSKSKGKKDFPTTSWTLVVKAGKGQTRAEESLNRLIGIYWPALYAYLVRDRGLAEYDAKDVLQGFLADKVVQQDLIARADRQRGKFRRYLQVALDRYAISIHRRQLSQRRSPGEDAILAIEDLPVEDRDRMPVMQPEQHAAYDLVWAKQTIEETLRRLKEHCMRTDRESHWMLFEERVVQPIWEGRDRERYADTIHRHGFSSPLQASNALLTVRRAFTRIFREVIREYALDEALVTDELEDIMNSLRQFGYKGELGVVKKSPDET